MIAGLLTALLLGLGSINPLVSRARARSHRFRLVSDQLPRPGGQRGGVRSGGHRAVTACCVRPPRLTTPAVKPSKSSRDEIQPDEPRPSLGDLAVLAFLASLAFMALEMVAGRLVQRHLGSSIYGWTSVIGVLLAGLSLGNFLGGKIADYVKSESQASWLFMAASILTLSVLITETQPKWFADHALGGGGKSLLSQAISLSKLEAGPVTISMSWPYRILFVVTLVFFLPAVSMGTVSPVVAKLAVDRLKRVQPHRHRDRPGLRLGHGRQHHWARS